MAALGGLSAQEYGAGQMSYDLMRLQRKGLLFRAKGSQRYYATPYGCKLARLYARLEVRVFRPALSALEGQAPPANTPLQSALRCVDRELDHLIQSNFPARQAA